MDMHLEWLRIRGFTPATVEARRRALLRMRRLLDSPLLEVSELELRAWRTALDTGPEATAKPAP